MPTGWEAPAPTTLPPHEAPRSLASTPKNAAPDAEPGRSCAGSEEEEIGGERILLALHHRSLTTSIFAVRMASSTRHRYSYHRAAA